MPSPVVTYVVSEVVDGDTVEVRGSDGTASTVRLIGVDAPEAGTCGAEAATADLSARVGHGEPVVLTPRARDDTDKYGRLLRDVDVNGVDAGLRLIEDGVAIARYDSRDGYGTHARETSYVTADATSVDDTCAPPATPAPATSSAAPADGCDPNDSGCVPIDSDVDCAGGSGNGPSYVRGPVRVVGSDIYDLDRDGDGIGCE